MNTTEDAAVALEIQATTLMASAKRLQDLAENMRAGLIEGSGKVELPEPQRLEKSVRDFFKVQETGTVDDLALHAGVTKGRINSVLKRLGEEGKIFRMGNLCSWIVPEDDHKPRPQHTPPELQAVADHERVNRGAAVAGTGSAQRIGSDKDARKLIKEFRDKGFRVEARSGGSHVNVFDSNGTLIQSFGTSKVNGGNGGDVRRSARTHGQRNAKRGAKAA